MGQAVSWNFSKVEVHIDAAIRRVSSDFGAARDVAAAGTDRDHLFVSDAQSGGVSRADFKGSSRKSFIKPLTQWVMVPVM